jgi:quercetin dioxygenase-like cupin family protein
MPIVRAADARRGDIGAGLATPSPGASELIVCSASAEPARVGRAHSHDREEVIVLTAGSAVAVLDGERYEVVAGDTVIVPAGVVHEFVAGDDGFECITCEPVGIRIFDDEGNERELPWTMR